MHIPDGYLSPSTCAVMTAAAAPFWYAALQRLKKTLSTKMVPLISIFAAFSFVVMMFNLPLPGGTTGHAAGMGIAAVVLGPWGSMIAISVALILQALLFGDGGILAIGANCFNMAIVGSLVAYGIYRLIAGRAPLASPRRVIAGAIAGYAAINVAALVAAIEFGVQPLLFRDTNGVPLYSFYPLSVAIPAMMIGHLTIAGFAEAIATGGVIAFLQRADISLLKASAPELDNGQPSTSKAPKLSPLLIGLLVLSLLSPLGLLTAGTAWGEWGTDELAAEQAGYHIRALSEPDRLVLVKEIEGFASNATDPSTANEYKAAASALANGDQSKATEVIQTHIDTLRTTDLKAYPQLGAVVAEIKDPQGLKQFSETWKAPLPDYAPDFIKDERVGYVLSALIGIVTVGAIGLIIGRLFTRREVRSSK